MRQWSRSLLGLDLRSGPAGEPVLGGATSGVLAITAWTVAYKVVSAICAAGITVITARALGPGGRGEFVLLFTLATVTYLACTFGVSTAARVHLVAKERVVESDDYIGLCAALTVLETVVCALLAAAVLPLVDVRLSATSCVLVGVLGGTFLAQYALFDAVNAYGETARASALDASGSVAQLIFVLVLARRDVDDVDPYLVALVVANLVQIILELLSLRGMRVSLRPRYRRAQWKLLLRTGVPGAVLSLAQITTFRLDRYLVGIFLTPAAVGLYSVAAAVPELLRVPAVALSNAFFYRIAAGSAEPDDFRRLRRAFIALAVGLSAATFIAAPLLIRLVFGPEYAGSVGPLRVLLLAEVSVCVFQLDGFSLAGLNRIGKAAAAAGLGLVVVTLADLVLIPALGINGASWASVLGYSAMGAAAAAFLRSEVRLRQGARRGPGEQPDVQRS